MRPAFITPEDPSRTLAGAAVGHASFNEAGVHHAGRLETPVAQAAAIERASMRPAFITPEDMLVAADDTPIRIASMRPAFITPED